MNSRLRFLSEPAAAVVEIRVPLRPFRLLLQAAISLFALGWAILGLLFLFAQRDPAGLAGGFFLLILALGIVLGIYEGNRYDLAWELNGIERIRVTDRELRVECVPSRLVQIRGVRALADVKRVFVACRRQWRTKAIEARGEPRTWLVVVAEGAREDLQFGMALGEADAQQVASFLLAEMTARGWCETRQSLEADAEQHPDDRPGRC